MNKQSLHTACSGAVLMAAAIGVSMAPSVRAARVACSVRTDQTTNVETMDGYADAVVDLAAFACGQEPRVMAIDESIARVASAMTEAVASVIATCEGEGDAVATVSGFARAEAQAEAVGRSTVSVIGQSDVCEMCQSSLNAITEITRSVSAQAVAEARLEATEIRFEEGETQTMTVQDIQRSMQENIMEVLASATGEIRASAADGCSSYTMIRSQVGDDVSECDVAVSADEISVELDAVAEAGANIQAMACQGENGNEVEVMARKIAVATVQAVTQTMAFCESDGGPGTMACGMTQGSVNAVATAQARAMGEGIASVMGESCGCDLNALVPVEEVADIMAAAASTSLSEACTQGEGTAYASDFQIETTERMAVALATAFSSAVGSDSCAASDALASACAQAGECAARSAVCQTAGGFRPCCDASNVCTRLPGFSDFSCQMRSLAEALNGEIAPVECS